jgi:hypothetical protein
LLFLCAVLIELIPLFFKKHVISQPTPQPKSSGDKPSQKPAPSTSPNTNSSLNPDIPSPLSPSTFDIENRPIPHDRSDTPVRSRSSSSVSSSSTDLWDNPNHIGAALSLLFNKTTHIQEQQTLMFAQMNAIGLNTSNCLTSNTAPTTPNATEVQELKCAYPIIVSTMEGDVPSEEDTAAFEAWKEESLKRGAKELREKGYEGSFVLASVSPVLGGGVIAKPGRPMAEEDNGSDKGKEKARYQPTVTDEDDEAIASTSEEKSGKEGEASQGTSTLGVPHYVTVTDDGNHPPMEDTVAFIEWFQARAKRSKAAMRATGVEGDAVLLDIVHQPRKETGASP